MNDAEKHRARIYLLIEQERKRQLHKWGKQDHPPDRWLAILHEETGEVAQAILSEEQPQVAAELIQSAAVCVAWLERLFTPDKEPAPLCPVCRARPASRATRKDATGQRWCQECQNDFDDIDWCEVAAEAEQASLAG